VTQRGVVQVDVPEPLPFRPPLRVVRAIRCGARQGVRVPARRQVGVGQRLYDASVAHCADKLKAKYIKGPDALGGAETFNFPNCEAYFVARRVGVQY